MNAFDSVRGSLVDPQAVSVAIDLVSSPLSDAKPTACTCVLWRRTNRCEGFGSQQCISLELH